MRLASALLSYVLSLMVPVLVVSNLNRHSYTFYMILMVVSVGTIGATMALSASTRSGQALGFGVIGLVFCTNMFFAGTMTAPADGVIPLGGLDKYVRYHGIVQHRDGTFGVMPPDREFFNYHDTYVAQYPSCIEVPAVDVEVTTDKVVAIYRFKGTTLVLPDNERCVLAFHSAIRAFADKQPEGNLVLVNGLLSRMFIQGEVKQALQRYVAKTEPLELANTRSVTLNWDLPIGGKLRKAVLYMDDNRLQFDLKSFIVAGQPEIEHTVFASQLR